jgi:hypothetical protein
MVDIMTPLATASQAIKLAQDLRGIDKAVDAAEYKLKIADLTGALSDIKMALSDAKDEIASKDTEIAKLKKKFVRIADTVEASGLKYDKNEQGQPKGRAYCPVCEQKSGLMIHFVQVLHTQQCPNCKGFNTNARVYPD